MKFSVAFMGSNFHLKAIIGCANLRFTVAVINQFLSAIVPLAEMAGFTPFLLQLLAFCSIQGILLLQTNLLCLFFHLLFPGFLWTSLLSLATPSRSRATLKTL